MDGHLELPAVSGHNLLKALRDLFGLVETAVLGEDIQEVLCELGRASAEALGDVGETRLLLRGRQGRVGQEGRDLRARLHELAERLEVRLDLCQRFGR